MLKHLSMSSPIPAQAKLAKMMTPMLTVQHHGVTVGSNLLLALNHRLSRPSSPLVPCSASAQHFISRSPLSSARHQPCRHARLMCRTLRSCWICLASQSCWASWAMTQRWRPAARKMPGEGRARGLGPTMGVRTGLRSRLPCIPRTAPRPCGWAMTGRKSYELQASLSLGVLRGLYMGLAMAP